MRKASVIVALVVSFCFLGAQASFGDLYYVCWKWIKRGSSGCIRCKGPVRSKDPSRENAATKCPAGQGQSFNLEKDALDFMATKCTCE
jgi:hypothetical protein